MTATLTAPTSARSGVRQYTTFYVGDLLLGVDIDVVQEINRQVDVTPVPNSSQHVRGVINLRGEVATVIDLRCVLGLACSGDSRDTRNLIVHSQGEAIGLCVDRISDILTITADEVSPPPANVGGVDGRYMQGVYAIDKDIVVLLDVEKALQDIE
jgi:purine-binding chemotaxis protein CheW